jgi:hypothetical protein
VRRSWAGGAFLANRRSGNKKRNYSLNFGYFEIGVPCDVVSRLTADLTVCCAYECALSCIYVTKYDSELGDVSAKDWACHRLHVDATIRTLIVIKKWL